MRTVPAALGAAAIGLTLFAVAAPPAQRPKGFAPRARANMLEARVAPPPIVTLEAPAEARETAVVVTDPAGVAKPRTIGSVPHALGSARRGTVISTSPLRVLVVAREAGSARGTSYGSALFRIEEGAAPLRLRGGLTDASRALVTDGGVALVQAGRDGEEPETAGKALRERVDTLTLEAVDPDKGTSRTVWSGRGLIAFLATPLGGDEALVFHVHDRGAALFALDARRGGVRPILKEMTPLARDFSYDRASDTIAFVRARADRRAYEVVTLPAHAATSADARVTVRFTGESDHLVPALLPGGAIALTPPGDHGLAILDVRASSASHSAPFGDGVDEVVAAHGSFIAVRHRTPVEERTAVVDRATGRVFPIGTSDRELDVAGFVREAAR